MTSRLVVSYLIGLCLLLILVFAYRMVTLPNVGKACGGFAANLSELQCPLGLVCKSNNSFPDAGGTCQQFWPLSAIRTELTRQYSSRKNEDSQESKGKFCGGIANIPCPEGYRCMIEARYPDAGGTCVRR